MNLEEYTEIESNVDLQKLYNESYPLFNAQPFNVDNIFNLAWNDKENIGYIVRAFNIFSLNSYLASSNSDHLRGITEEGYTKFLYDEVNIILKIPTNHFNDIRMRLLNQVGYFIVSELKLKRWALEICEQIKTKRSRIEKMKEKVLSEPGIIIPGREDFMKIIHDNEFERHLLNTSSKGLSTNYLFDELFEIRYMNEEFGISVGNICRIMESNFEFFEQKRATETIYQTYYKNRKQLKEKFLQLIELDKNIHKEEYEAQKNNIDFVLKWMESVFSS